MVHKYNLPLDPLSQWCKENVQKWEIYPELEEEFPDLFQNHTLSGIKEQAETIHAALNEIEVPFDLGLPLDTCKYKNLSGKQIAYIKAMQAYVEIWYDEKFNSTSS
jgi:hypothetical protein